MPNSVLTARLRWINQYEDEFILVRDFLVPKLKEVVFLWTPEGFSEMKFRCQTFNITPQSGLLFNFDATLIQEYGN